MKTTALPTTDTWTLEPSIASVIKRARRRYPNQADDVAQEARLAAWLASQSGKSTGYVRAKAKFAVVNYVRPRYHWQKVQPEFECLFEDQVGAPDPEPIECPTEVLADLRFLFQATAFTGVKVAAGLGLSSASLCQRRAKARARVAAWWASEAA